MYTGEIVDRRRRRALTSQNAETRFALDSGNSTDGDNVHLLTIICVYVLIINFFNTKKRKIISIESPNHQAGRGNLTS